MVTQPQLAVFASSSKRLRSRVLHGTEFRFVFTNVTRLVDYALQLGIGAVIRRLDLYRLAPDNELARLRTELTDT